MDFGDLANVFASDFFFSFFVGLSMSASFTLPLTLSQICSTEVNHADNVPRISCRFLEFCENCKKRFLFQVNAIIFNFLLKKVSRFP